MITVAIVGTLTVIALPSYSEYTRRGHRADARTGLMQTAQWLKRAATANGVYPTGLPNAFEWKDGNGISDPGKRYDISFVAGNSNAVFTLQAIPKRPGPQASDKCGAYTLSNTRVRGANGKISGQAGYDASC